MDSFFNVDILRDDRGVDELLTGMTLTPVQRADNNFADDITNHLFDGALNGLDCAQYPVRPRPWPPGLQ